MYNENNATYQVEVASTEPVQISRTPFFCLVAFVCRVGCYYSETVLIHGRHGGSDEFGYLAFVSEN